MNKTKSKVKAYASLSEEDKARIVAQRVIEARIDITGDYKQWLNICFGFTLVMGEGGRTLFHDISQFHHSYNYKECDKLYDDCLKRLQSGGKEGITIASFYKYAKDAGISISTLTEEECNHTAPYLTPNAPNAPVGELGELGQTGGSVTPGIETAVAALNLFSPNVAGKLSKIFQDIASLGTTAQQKDMLIFASLALLSGCFPEVWASYDNRLVFANLYCFLVAPPASNKGIVSACLKLVDLIEQEIRESNEREMEEFKQRMAELRASKNKGAGYPMEKEPPFRSLLISANSSSTALYQALADNNGEGITFETEADSLAFALKSDYGNFGDGMRKGFHHECISYTRRTDKEHVRIRLPKWSVFLTGTPGQVTNLVPSCEDGLFSRIIFMSMRRENKWRNVFAKREQTIDGAMEAIGRRVYAIHRLLRQAGKKGIEFVLTEKQQDRFNDFFDKLYREYGSMMEENFDANVLRMGLSCFRIAMVLSITRLEDAATLPQTIVCTDDDFDAAVTIANTLIEHSAFIFSNLMPAKETDSVSTAKLSELQRKLFKALPDHFTTQQALAMTKKLDMLPKTIGKYLGYFVTRFHICKRTRPGEYEKVKATENKEENSQS